jgi:hypothetical protein
LERSLDWYAKILPQAQAIARRQGYTGVRWPKMCGPNGVSSPSGVGEFLVWQQPHFIAMAELVYRAKTTNETLAKYAPLVDETATFMADFVEWEVARTTCHLGPPLIPSQENYDRRTTRDPTFELAYWHGALSTAQKWRERRGEPRDAAWDRVIAGLPKPHVADGSYAAVATPPFTNTSDHPSMLAAYGVVPATPLVDPATMLRTALWVDDNWQWEKTWGWDFPMCAMTYARCGEPERAVDALLRATKKNTYLPLSRAAAVYGATAAWRRDDGGRLGRRTRAAGARVPHGLACTFRGSSAGAVTCVNAELFSSNSQRR